MNTHTIRRLVPLAVLAIVVAFAASASAGAASSDEDKSQASTATTSKATVKSLSKQLKKLTRRIVALEQKKFPDSLPPSGPANGDLTGTYPNPTIKDNVIGPGKIPDETLTGFEIAPDSLFHNDLAPDSVGGSELKGSNVVVSGGVSVPANQTRSTSVTCPAGQHLLSGGFAYQGTAGRILDSAPSLTVPNRWEVRGSATADDALFAWALCLQV